MSSHPDHRGTLDLFSIHPDGHDASLIQSHQSFSIIAASGEQISIFAVFSLILHLDRKSHLSFHASPTRCSNSMEFQSCNKND